MADNDLRECLNKCSGYYAEHHFTEPQVITCKWCGSENVNKYGVRDGVQEYICIDCGRKFNEKDAPYGMRTPVEQIGASLNLYYTGSSLTDIANHLAQVYNNPVSRSSIYAWLLKYSVEAVELLSTLKPQRLSNVWLADETAIKFDYELYWIWDVIDRDTRFLLASYLSPRRGTQQARILMELALEQAERPPKKVITDKLRAYIDGIELVFGSETVHIQSSPFADSDSTNIIERFQGTIKERTKVLWGFKTVPAAKIIIGGFVCHYNFFRPHIALNNRTPAEVAGTDSPITTWTDLVRMVR
jgi:transposase-like protein